MEILLVDPLVPEALSWLQARHDVSYRPELGDNLIELRKNMYKTRAVVLPPHVIVSQEFLNFSPKLQVVARMQISSDNTDLDACARRHVRVIQARSATVRSNAEYVLYGLFMLYRRGMVSALLGRKISEVRMGRELAGSTVGLLGLAPVAHTLAPMLKCLGVRLVGYDPAVHHAAPIWEKLGVEPVTVQELLSLSDAVSLQMVYASRFKGWINERLLNHCKPGQLWVGVSRSALFDPDALAYALTDGRIDACLLDGANPSFVAEGTLLHNVPNLHLTPRLGSHTREAKLRASWYVAHRIHETLSPVAARKDGPQSTFSVHDSLDYADQEDPQAVSPSQWSSLDLHRR
ncbi:MAG: NAD(P)-dependent oxidoreductase [Hydrogenophaga sp.]|uniref:NAD(P)-dependent oxidoreductase n=1 Tax=Hydrogenophaga sp. TaxID=1904254 RepID=UPI0027199E09|nr:NAD(P)-dependent oxidoreductase [Hydrogenophaga sp.]MDO9146300.1 NAD(P)-dependent oxidoreductase [Hydrogenophaga sp.]MDO9604689.1 NAD(P)-dependent oxidoreductase [Hydrogenophaga sp.]MDP2163471.1 NAD(P)-dependent oxidoreductase [Hydrogenophaga sp.]MDP3478072.1 NAD(P)-dependent oxidoreductase [Hydrogenophaga sp.]